jgi:hypothetical protein
MYKCVNVIERVNLFYYTGWPKIVRTIHRDSLLTTVRTILGHPVFLQ